MKRIKKRIKNSKRARNYMLSKSKIKPISLFKVQKIIHYKKYDVAIDHLVNLDQKDEKVRYLLGQAYIKKGESFKGIELLDSLQTNHSEINQYYAMAYQSVNQIDKAVNYWSKVKRISQLDAKQLLLAGTANLIVDDKETADEFLNELMKKSSKKDDVWDLLAKNNYWNYAAQYLQAHCNETNAEELEASTFEKLSQMYLKSFDYDAAKKNIKQAINVSPEPKYYYMLSGICQLLGDNDEGIQAINSSGLLGKGEMYKATYILGSHYFIKGDLENCAKSFIEYSLNADIYTYEIVSNPDYQQAVQAELAEDYETAVNLYTKVSYRYEGHCGLLFSKIGEMYYRLNRFDEACESFMMYNLSPDFPVYPLGSKGYTRDVIQNSEYYDYLTVRDNFVLYTSFSGSSFTGSPYALFKQLYTKPDLIHFVVYNGIENKNLEIEKLDNVYCIQANSKLHRRICSQAKILITNGTFPYAYIPRDEQIILNTWHGTPIKYLGYDVEDASYLLSRNVRNSFITSTHMIHPNQFTMDAMNNSFKLVGASDTNIAVTGYPRQDLMINISENRKDVIKEYLGIDKSKPVVLYAPTYRDSLLVTGEQRDTAMFEAVSKLSEAEEYNFLFKGHYFDASAKNKTNDIDTNELLSIVDVLISDYSSIVIDFMALKKPIIYFTYDLEEYRSERGFYFEIDTITDSMVSTLAELEKMIGEKLRSPVLDAKQLSATEKYCKYDDGKASERVIDFMLSKQTEKIKKEKILVYIGNLLNLEQNKIYFENQLNSYDKNNQEVTILIDENELKKDYDETYIDELIERGYLIAFYYGTLSKNIIEHYGYLALNRNNNFYNQRHKDICFSLMHRNAKRLFARCHYDTIDVIDNINNRDIMMTLAAIEATNKTIYFNKKGRNYSQLEEEINKEFYLIETK